MYTSQGSLDELDKALAALSGPLPDRAVELIASAQANLAELRKMIRLDELDEPVVVADAEAEEDRLEAAIEELRPLLPEH